MNSYISYDLTSEEVYNRDGDVVGYDDYVLIEKLFVAVEDRRQGVARKMLRDAIADIRKEHGNKMSIRLAALPFGEDAIEMEDLVAFYESEGFSVVYAGDSDAVIMEL